MSLIAALEEKGAALSAKAIEQMYESDPFWKSRFAERGRSYANADGVFHLKYLLQALRSDNVEVLTTYARWLQSVLVARGMCSLHLAENFDRFAALISAEIPGSAQAVDLLKQASKALEYFDGPGQQLQRCAAAVSDALAGTDGAHPTRADVSTLVSYLGDALQAARPELFVGYAAWLSDFLRSRGRSTEHLGQLLAALRAQLTQAPPLSESTKRAAEAAIDTAIAHLSRAAA